MRLHAHESDRIESLRSYGILDTAAEPQYDALTRLAAMLCKTPVALISLIDENRQWFKSTHGMDATETSREISFCSDAVADEQLLVIPDTLKNPDYSDNPAVVDDPGVRAYAGVPLIGRDGLPLGTLCVIDVRPRQFSAEQLTGLELLADQVVAQLELRRIEAAMPEVSAVFVDTCNPRRLRRALDDGELIPHFQPMVDLSTGRTVGFEALLRWYHPEHGLLPPSVFLSAIENSGLVLPVGRRVLDLSLAMIAELRADPTVPEFLGVAVNVSGAQFTTPGLAATVLAALARHGVPPEQLSIEITETVPIVNTANARNELTALRDAGVSIALDDYGVGFSALGRLIDLPLSALKLDRSFVQGLPGDAPSLAVATSTFALAKAMGIDVVCEGIETEEQLAALRSMGAKYGQGWLFGRPMDRQSVAGHLRQQTTNQLRSVSMAS
jgi:EAL domain-containing protein (putative c-di-GMP-specific phosphodiesterase class I)